MEPISEECRLCLHSLGECFTTIDNPQLKNQMEKVFRFSIDSKQGYCSGVCQSCSYAISEFYQYSEKVRQNQEILNRNVTNCDPTVDSNITLQHVKFGKHIDSGLPESAAVACKPKSEVLEEETPTVYPKITHASVKVETLSDSVLPETTEYGCESEDAVLEEERANSGDDESFVPTMDTIITLESVKFETLSDSELTEMIAEACKPRGEITLESIKVDTRSDPLLSERTKDASESKAKISKEEKVPNSGEYESFEPLTKKLQTERKGRPGKRKLADSNADEPTTNFKQTAQQELAEQDQLMSKHIPMICDLCGTAAATFTALRKHFRTEHNQENGYVVCCNKKLFKRYTILDHIAFHSNPDVFRCELCGNKYRNKLSLTEHMRCKHSGAGCVCPQCNRVFACKRYLNYHMASQHKGTDRSMVCNVCCKKFLKKLTFDQHMNEHMGNGTLRFQCRICQRWLKTKTGLRNHMKTFHIDVDPEFQCDTCRQTFPHSRALYYHKVQMHTEPKHECEFCGEKFKKASSLKDHRATHTGEVLHICMYCRKSKKNRKILLQHIRRLHPKEWAQNRIVKKSASEGIHNKAVLVNDL